MHDRFVKELMTTVRCTVCGTRYQAANVSIRYHQGELWFVSVFCESCRNLGLVAALVREGKAARIITDLTEAELEKFRNSRPVSSDDLLDMHDFLKSFDGDFKRLFGGQAEL